MGSNDWECLNAVGTTTADDTYNPIYPLLGDIHWHPLLAADVTPSGYDLSSTNDISGTETKNASSTSILLTDVNWNCLRTEYRGASTTVLMQMKQKVLQ